MRQLLGEKKLKALRLKTGLPIIKAMVRGNTGHRIDLILENNQTASYDPHTGEVEIDKNK